jgi:hypothetical protein
VKPAENLTQLVRMLVERRSGYGGAPLILFLGRSCAAAAGVPDTLSIARQVISDPDLKQMYSECDLADDNQVLEVFTDFLADLTASQRLRMLQSFYARLAVPSFYQDLALLIQAGYFRHILTTSIDTLLEQALNGAGLWPEKDYQVIGLGMSSEKKPTNSARSAPDERITIVKLHGDLAQSQVAITREEIAGALEPQRYFIKGELAGDLVVVGYEFESQPLNRWLSWVPGDAWWVSEEMPGGEEIAAIEETRRIFHITGDAARPENFFGQLVYLLWHTPLFLQEKEAVVEAASEYDKEEDWESFVEEEFSDVEFIQSQLQRSRAMLINLEQTAGPDQRGLSWQSQIEYQRKRITELEDQLRSLEGNRNQVLDLLIKVNKAAGKSASDPNLTTFLRAQLRSVRREYERPEPNQAIVSAAIGATLSLAERLDVDKDTLDSLSKFAPTSWGRRL